MSDIDDVDDARDGSGPEIRTRLDRLIAASGSVLAWGTFLAFAASTIEVVARYGFNRPTIWAHETTTFLIAVVFLVGGPVALARDKHIAPAQQNAIVAQARALGVDTAALIWVTHERQDPAH